MKNRKVRYLLLSSFCFYLVALANDALPMFLLCWATLSLILVSYVLSRLALTGLRCQRDLGSSRLFAEDRLPGTLALSNLGSFPKANLLVTDRCQNVTLGESFQRTFLVSWLGGAERAQIPARFIAPLRGCYRWGPISVVATDPLGIFEARRDIEATAAVIVYPRPRPLVGFSLAPGERVNHQANRRKKEAGLDFQGVREYCEGDDLRRIHWKATAHHGQLVMREFEAEGAATTTVVLDLQEAQCYGQGPESSLEEGVLITASLVGELLRHNWRVRFLAHEERRLDVAPGRGQEQLFRILEILAVVTGRGKLPVETILRGELFTWTEGQPLFLVTASRQPGVVEMGRWLARRQIPFVVIALVGPTFESPAPEPLEPHATKDRWGWLKKARDYFLRPTAHGRAPAGWPTAHGPFFDEEAGGEDPQAGEEPSLRKPDDLEWVDELQHTGATVIPIARGDDWTTRLGLSLTRFRSS